MRTKQKLLAPQPTESEAIVAADREPQSPDAPLTAPVPLPVEVAADLPVDSPVDKSAAKSGAPI